MCDELERRYRQLERERDLLEHLLQIGLQEDVETVVSEALALMLDVAGADKGYMEAFDPCGPRGERLARWRAATALSDARIDVVRAAISQGIIGQSLRDGKVVETVSAVLDPRFSGFDSVQRGGIEAVLCVPIGTDHPIGVLYLEGHRGGGRFGPEVRRLAELFAEQVAPALELVITRDRDAEPDPTVALRAQLEADELIGKSQAMVTLLRQIALVAPLEIDVLLTGPSGSGKSVVGRVIARNSERADEPLVELNCAAIPDELVESELFGAEPGAHSTATRRMKGKVAAAEGGTLFLDEIGELSLRAQAKLLQLIQDKAYFPLGADAPAKADIRIVAASQRDLHAAVQAGTFRQDLFYRLNVMPIAIPGLDARRDDIPALTRAFVRQTCQHHGLTPLTVSPGALAAAMAASWDGHIRQLRHRVEAAAIRASGAGADELLSEHLFPGDGGGSDSPSLYEATQAFQRDLITNALREAKGNVSAAARQLRVARSHLYRLMSSLGLQRNDA